MSSKPYVPIEQIVQEYVEDCSSRVIHDVRREPPYKAAIGSSLMTFGDCAVSRPSPSQTNTVTNIGYLPLPILSVTAVGTDFLASNDAPLVLAPGESFQISVMLVAQHTGPRTGGIYIDIGDAIGDRFISLTGVGV